MKTSYRIGVALLAAVLLLTGCGKAGNGADSKKDSNKTTGATVNYEDYVTPVVDRKIKDCITVDEINALFDELGLSYNMVEDPYPTDSTVKYHSNDGRTITLMLENITREQFDARVASNPNYGWIDLANYDLGGAYVGEAAYWNGDQSELIAYENGYAFSMSVQNIANAAMIGMTEIILEDLRG